MNTTEIANQIWQTFSNSEKKMARFGIFPATKMNITSRLSFDENHSVTCELMKLAKNS